VLLRVADGYVDDALAAVLEDDDAAVAEPPRCAVGAAEHGRLGADLRLERRGRERSRLDDAGVGGPAGGGIEQVVSGLAVR